MRQCIPSIETAVARAEDLRRLRQRAAQLSLAVQQNRATGVAVGILVERLRLSRDEAFETLRRRARSRRRTVPDIAEQLVTCEETLNEMIRDEARAQQ
jgi:AmiR/NasT family two-component response regulator